MNTLGTLNTLRHFIGSSQRRAILAGLRGEEAQYFRDTLDRLAGIIAAMPATYGQEDAESPIAYLHYFAGGQASWWITEKDAGSPDDPEPEKGRQHQAFGLANLYQDGGEIGYISIAEIIENGGELDFHFTPKMLAEIRREGAARQHLAGREAATGIRGRYLVAEEAQQAANRAVEYAQDFEQPPK